MSHQQICWHGRVESLLRYNYQVLNLGNYMMKLSIEAGLMAIIPRAFGSAGTYSLRPAKSSFRKFYTLLIQRNDFITPNYFY